MKNKTKAIAVYLDDSDNMETELSWLYKTWILNGLDKEWDLVVYYNPAAEKRLESFVGIRKISMAPVRRSNWYPFLNSHYFCLMANYPIKDYEFLLKTDCDVFLTHNLRGYKPSVFHYGLGGWYNSKDTAKMTHWMKHELSPSLKLSNGKPCDYRFMTNVGASYLGKANWVINITLEQALLTEQLLDMFEKSPFYCDLGLLDGYDAPSGKTHRVIGPNVLEGIASMIGGEIAVNSLMYPQHAKAWALDTKCHESVDIGTDVLHIHAWHTHSKFSKHAFFQGKYDDWTVHYDNRLDNCANYCQWIATTPIEEIRKIAKKGGS